MFWGQFIYMNAHLYVNWSLYELQTLQTFTSNIDKFSNQVSKLYVCRHGCT